MLISRQNLLPKGPNLNVYFFFFFHTIIESEVSRKTSVGCIVYFLFLDNTMYNGVPGHWSAWLVDLDGQRGEWGIVPSKYKVDEELLKRNIDSDSELGMGSAGSGVSVAGKTFFIAS